MLSDRKLPIGLQDFEKLRLGENVYVDKTRYLYNLIKLPVSYFLSRPRRFGKSLFLSTLKAYFLGRKELFDGLAIAELEKDWIQYPVFHIDMSEDSFIDLNSFYQALNTNLSRLEEQWGKNENETTPSSRLLGLIRRAYEKSNHRVVVLIDEYDKPLVNSLHKSEVNESMREVLKGFYGILKSADAYLHFVFITGVTKFSQVSVFSDLNNLTDISLNKNYAAICGISEEELIQYFDPEINNLAREINLTYDETLAKLRKYYNGYRFSKVNDRVYNPFSILNTFFNNAFDDYWYGTGSPTFLIRMLKAGNLEIPNLENNIPVSVRDMTNYRVGSNNPVPILYQSGYLTIKDYDSKFDEFTLGFPNEEVKLAFLNELLPIFIPQYESGQKFSVAHFIKTLEKGDIEDFMNNMRAFYASISYDMIENKHKNERYYQFIFYLLVTFMGQFIQTEVKTATGHIDAVIKTVDAIYVFEFKMSTVGTAEEALAQIDTKDYLLPYNTDRRRLVKIGAEFDDKEHGISRWKILSDL